jgi:hypothetical protein
MGVHSLFRLVNQVAYAFVAAPTMEPFHNLLRPKTQFAWTLALQSAFDEFKRVLINKVIVGVMI